MRHASLELITMGRVGVDLYPGQVGVPLSRVTSFSRSLGGSPTNVAVGAARLGRRSAVITRVGADAFGTYVRAALDGFGVDGRWVGTDPSLRTPLAFCELFPPDRFPLVFYREPKAPDMRLSLEDLDVAAIQAAPLFWTSGTGLSEEPSREATLAALDSRDDRAITVHDLDHRPSLWHSEGEAAEMARLALGRANVAVGNLDEVAMAVGEWSDPSDAAAALLDCGVNLAVVKLGPDGALARTEDQSVRVGPLEVEVVNGLGAGDAFGAALCHSLLSGWDLERTLRFANAAGAIVAARLACADAMPTEGEVETAMASGCVRAGGVSTGERV